MIFSPNLRQQLFDRWAATYDFLFPSVFYQAIHQRLLHYVHRGNHPTVLDIGCGTGRLLDRLATQYSDLSGTGIDFSPQMLDQANQHNRYPDRITYCQGNAEALPFADEQFDAVFNTISFLHYDHPAEVLSEVLRVLRPGGAFYLVDFTLRWATQPYIYTLLPHASIRVYSPAVREAMAQQVGFVEVVHHYLLGPVLLSVLKKG